jgi:hypothetical protein
MKPVNTAHSVGSPSFGLHVPADFQESPANHIGMNERVGADPNCHYQPDADHAGAGRDIPLAGGRPVGRYVRHVRHLGGAATLIHVDLLLAAPKTSAG